MILSTFTITIIIIYGFIITPLISSRRLLARFARELTPFGSGALRLLLATLLLRGRGRAPLLIRAIATLSSGFQRSNGFI
ncbi:MAG: Unknown protein [uncultured Aureispira sp.]|uniref:Uncharacterized protein n=1 Tax=uncultured Aureispira sp. TaxID=1331704 RepID=A0A6S6T680_9BACT|nr:MAG: Unknown protein [uncultured Aureispira sp.]